MRRTGGVLANFFATLSFVALISTVFFGDRVRKWWRDYQQRHCAAAIVLATPSAGWSCFGGNSAFIDELRTEAALLTSENVLAAALVNPMNRIHSTDWFRSFDSISDARGWLKQHVHCEVLPDSQCIRISIDNKLPKHDAEIVVEDIARERIEQVRDRRARFLAHASQLNERKTVLERRIRKLHPQVRALALQCNDDFVLAARELSEDLTEYKCIKDQLDTEAGELGPSLRLQ